jgi:hypothetical protein
MKKLLTLLFLLICLPLTDFAQIAAPPRDDTQEWTEVHLIPPLHDKLDLTMVTGLRLGRNLSHLIDERAGLQLAFKANKYLTLTPGYLYRANQQAPGRKFYEHWAFGAATLRVPLPRRFTVSDRNFYEYRFRNSLPDTSRYRNRAQLERPVRLGGRLFTPFIANEAWYDFKAHGWMRNRFFWGVTRRFAKKIAGEFFYMRQSDRRARPGDLNVIGSTFRVNF